MYESGLMIVTLLLPAVTITLLVAVAVRVYRKPSTNELTREALHQIVRAEGDALRRTGDDQARGVRQEVAEHLRGLQETTMSSFSVLGEVIKTQLSSFGHTLEVGVAGVEKHVQGLGGKLDVDLSKMGEDALRNREGLRALIEHKLDASASTQSESGARLREELSANFQRLASVISGTLAELGQQQKERLEATTQALGALNERNEKAHESLKGSVEQRLDAIRQESATKLEEMRRTVDEKLQSTLEARLGESFSRVVDHLNRVHEGLGEMKSLAANVGDLKSVLTNVKVRGIFGEVQLELLLEQFLTPDQYVKDAKVKEHTSERVEFAVRLPGQGGGEELLLPIDAKFPRETYERLLEASEAGEASAIVACRKQLEAQIRACAKDICEKYVNPPKTTNFAIMFLPTEGLYAEVLRQVGVFECLQRDHKVILAGPTTFSAILSALQMGFRTLTIEKRSSEVWQVLAAVKTEFGKYNGVVEGLTKQLNTALKSVDNLGTRTRAMTRTLRDVEDLPSGVLQSSLIGLEDSLGLSGPEDQTSLLPNGAHSEIIIPEGTG